MNREERFTEVFARDYREVYRFLLRRTDPDVAREIAQETFTTAWQRLEKVPDDPEASRAWLYTVARNHLLHHNRAHQRRAALAIRLAGEPHFAGESPD
ncbi:MAG: hypothetical protein LBB58_05085 [Cellulomonadaceae bacterium]|jgi:RNA polymerase sigma-70 factor (ECF subfamily)|nr:hypothetical protein [Cellulomonadaceae bacterium]